MLHNLICAAPTFTCMFLHDCRKKEVEVEKEWGKKDGWNRGWQGEGRKIRSIIESRSRKNNEEATYVDLSFESWFTGSPDKSHILFIIWFQSGGCLLELFTVQMKTLTKSSIFRTREIAIHYLVTFCFGGCHLNTLIFGFFRVKINLVECLPVLTLAI